MLDRSGDSQEGPKTESSSLCNDRPWEQTEQEEKKTSFYRAASTCKQDGGGAQARTANTSSLNDSGAATVLHFDGDAFRK